MYDLRRLDVHQDPRALLKSLRLRTQGYWGQRIQTARTQSARDSHSVLDIYNQRIYSSLMCPYLLFRSLYRLCFCSIICRYNLFLAAIEAQPWGRLDGMNQRGRLDSGEGLRAKVARRSIKQELIHTSVAPKPLDKR